MKTRISALMDGELEGHEITATLRALHDDPDLRREWCDGHLIGAALRGEEGLAIDVAARVMAALHAEPTVLAPRPRPAQWRRPALALAASAAGVAVVGWLALAPATKPAGVDVARIARSAPQVAPQSTPRLQEYLVAHHAYAPGGAMVGGARNVRTVSVSSERR